MAVASLRINQPTHSTQPTGPAGQARDDLELGKPVVVSNVNDTDVNRWRWTLVDIPIDSVAVLSDPTQPSVTFTPDKTGSYLLRLSVNDGLAGEIDTKVAAVRDSLGIRYPATGERGSDANYQSFGSPNTKGWGKDVEATLRSIALPQTLLGTAQAETLSISASETFVVGGLGLPDSSGEITNADFVDYTTANTGNAPTVNGYMFADIAGDAGLASICSMTVDLDTSGSTIGDEWAMILLTIRGNLLIARITLA